MTQQQKNFAKEWLKTYEVPHEFPLSASWLEKKRMQRNSDGPKFTRVGRCIYYSRKEIEAYLAERTARSVAA